MARNNGKENDVAKVPITERALTRRLSRALRAQVKHLRIATKRRQKALGLGHYYIVGAEGVIDANVHLEEWARKLGVIQPWETLKPNR